MKPIALKEKFPITFYIISFILGIIILIIGFSNTFKSSSFIFCVFGMVLLIISIYYFVIFIKTPNIIISINDNNELILPQNVRINCNELIDISYKKTTAKGYSYSYGKIIIDSKKGTYTYNFVKDCENTCKELTRLMYENK